MSEFRKRGFEAFKTSGSGRIIVRDSSFWNKFEAEIGTDGDSYAVESARVSLGNPGIVLVILFLPLILGLILLLFARSLRPAYREAKEKNVRSIIEILGWKAPGGKKGGEPDMFNGFFK